MPIENPPAGSALGRPFDIHPPIAKRIAVLEALGGHAPDVTRADTALQTQSPWQ